LILMARAVDIHRTTSFITSEQSQRMERLGVTELLQTVIETVPSEETDVGAEVQCIAGMSFFVISCLILWSQSELRLKNIRMSETPLHDRMFYLFGLKYDREVLDGGSGIMRIASTFLSSFGMGMVLMFVGVNLVMRGIGRLFLPKQLKQTSSAVLPPSTRFITCGYTSSVTLSMIKGDFESSRCDNSTAIGPDWNLPTFIEIPSIVYAPGVDQEMTLSFSLPLRSDLPAQIISVLSVGIDSTSNTFVYGLPGRSIKATVDYCYLGDVVTPCQTNLAETPAMYAFSSTGRYGIFKFKHAWPALAVGATEAQKQDWCRTLVYPIVVTVISPTLTSERSLQIVPKGCSQFMSGSI